MSKVITVEELVANIEEHLANVERGETLTLVKGGTPVAEVRAVDGIRPVHMPPPGVRTGDFRPTGGRPKGLVSSSTDLLSDDRDGEWAKNGVR